MSLSSLRSFGNTALSTWKAMAEAAVPPPGAESNPTPDERARDTSAPAPAPVAAAVAKSEAAERPAGKPKGVRKGVALDAYA